MSVKFDFHKIEKMKLLHTIPLVSWENGIWMIGVFAVVVIVLVGGVLALMNSGKNGESKES
ncbi:hypothetical protein ACOKFD_13890 [Flagellimonas sp. S174]|uniref:hypothetical protein n=1 Tax=Flagellimonas sp. S174 TaxID=3410790 RepID=UPI002628454D|nr:hypothetical protein [uncultured Allomuricauda sp.]